MKPEDLKQLAEYMGHEANLWDCTDNGLNTVGYREKGNRLWAEYNPLTNAEQCLELMEKFKINLQYDDIVSTKIMWRASFNNNIKVGRGKTINEAVTLAAIAAITGE